MKKIVTPASTLIEKTALNCAQAFYEIGRSQGLPSKYKTGRHYAARYMEKFIPHAVDALMKQLCDPNTPVEAKDLILAAFRERMNDPEAAALANSSQNHSLPDIDIAKLIPIGELPSVIANPKVVKDYGILGITGKRR